MFRLFRREKSQPPVPAPEAPRAYTEQEIDAVYDALTKGLGEIERRCVDRAVLTVYECAPSQTGRGRWESDRTADGKPVPCRCYYPFETLPPEEQAMIRAGRNYKVISLARKNVGGLVEYDNGGVELYHRTSGLFLNELDEGSNLRYFSEGGVYTEEELRGFARIAAESGETPETIGMAVEAGIQEYREISERLMGGVYDAIDEMEDRRTPFEQIMHDMRDNIQRAKSNGKR